MTTTICVIWSSYSQVANSLFSRFPLHSRPSYHPSSLLFQFAVISRSHQAVVWRVACRLAIVWRRVPPAVTPVAAVTADYIHKVDSVDCKWTRSWRLSRFLCHFKLNIQIRIQSSPSSCMLNAWGFLLDVLRRAQYSIYQSIWNTLGLIKRPKP